MTLLVLVGILTLKPLIRIAVLVVCQTGAEHLERKAITFTGIIYVTLCYAKVGRAME